MKITLVLFFFCFYAKDAIGDEGNKCQVNLLTYTQEKFWLHSSNAISTYEIFYLIDESSGDYKFKLIAAVLCPIIPKEHNCQTPEAKELCPDKCMTKLDQAGPGM